MTIASDLGLIYAAMAVASLAWALGLLAFTAGRARAAVRQVQADLDGSFARISAEVERGRESDADAGRPNRRRAAKPVRPRVEARRTPRSQS